MNWRRKHLLWPWTWNLSLSAPAGLRKSLGRSPEVALWAQPWLTSHLRSHWRFGESHCSSQSVVPWQLSSSAGTPHYWGLRVWQPLLQRYKDNDRSAVSKGSSVLSRVASSVSHPATLAVHSKRPQSKLLRVTVQVYRARIVPKGATHVKVCRSPLNRGTTETHITTIIGAELYAYKLFLIT